MSDIKLEKIMTKKTKGYPFDQYRCFHIKDFKRGDSIRVKEKGHPKHIRGIVLSIDLDDNHIIYKTADLELNRTVIENIVSLEDYKPNWLG